MFLLAATLSQLMVHIQYPVMGNYKEVDTRTYEVGAPLPM